MRRSRLPLALLLALAASAPVCLLRADDFLPKGHQATRYDQMASRSPFTPPTAAAPAATPPPAVAGPHWWDQMFVTALMDKGGVYFAGVIDRQNNKRYLLELNKPDEESHLVLASVQWGERSDQTTITVRKDTEVAPPLRFDTSAAPMPTAQHPGNPSNQSPGALLFANPQRPPPTFTPPPAPPTNTVVRRNIPISARPGASPQSSNPALNRPDNGSAPRRIVVPKQGDDDGE